MRVGINTGEVLVGTLAGSDYTAMGDVVNTASRLQALAPPGGVLIGSATAALCSPTIARDPFGVTRLRGREQVEQSWLVTGAAAAGTRPVRCDVPFVGRAHERALMDAAVQLVRNGHSGVVSIIGEAGAGKSRLADEIIVPLEGEATVVRTACAPYGESNVWAPVVAGLSTLFDLDPDVERGRHRADRRPDGRASCGACSPATPSCSATSTPSPTSSATRRRSTGSTPPAPATPSPVTLTDMLRRHAQTRMTVLWVDNLQWADPSLRDQLAVVVRSLSDLPFLLVTGSAPGRATACGRRPSSARSWCRCRSGRSSIEDATDLVCGILERGDGDEPSERIVAELVDRGGGNPLFLVELAGLAATCGGSVSELPGSLRALIAARIDQLPAPQRAIIDNAAVLGSSDSIGSLARFGAGDGPGLPRRPTSTSWPPTGCSRSTVGGGASAAPSSARSPTRR